jgi:multicomponent Na+:H+ antiporter subunit A
VQHDRSPILATSAPAIFVTAMAFSLYLLFAGHDAPGGGFVGGLVAGAALVLRYADAGVAAVRRLVPLPPPVLLGSGLGLAVLTGAVPWIGGADFLESAELHVELPVLGTVETTSALPFDVGVYLVVVGVVLSIIQLLGDEVDT